MVEAGGGRLAHQVHRLGVNLRRWRRLNLPAHGHMLLVALRAAVVAARGLSLLLVQLLGLLFGRGALLLHNKAGLLIEEVVLEHGNVVVVARVGGHARLTSHSR